ncbi:excalibur calcium-binding domain-containing protein [Streptomyces sp. NBC_00048]
MSRRPTSPRCAREPGLSLPIDRDGDGVACE